MKFLLRLKWWATIMAFLMVVQAYGQEYTVTSPSGALKINVVVSEDIKYEVLYNDISLISPSAISITLKDGLILGKEPVVETTETQSVNKTITPLYGKSKEIEDHYNELVIDFTTHYALILRAYDEGVAYRFRTALEGEVVVESEEANFNLSGTPSVLFPEADPTMRSWERAYDNYSSIQDIDEQKFSVTPTMFSYEDTGIRVVIAESDLFDYPGMYLQRNKNNGMKGKWAHYPKTVSDPDDVYAYHRVLEREDFLAKTSGTRLYPWRAIIVSAEDKDLLNNQLIYKLATPSVLTNTAWIKPGKSAWEWWHDAILETTQIPSGTDNLSFELYKYYVDFAAEYDLEYITMDAGWSMDYAAKVCEYAATKGVKVFLWDFINLPVTNPERLTQIKNIGAAGVKIDLIERDDQIAINWFEQLAKDCADRELMVIFHGCAKPTGLQRTYPNIVNFEAVRGAECAKWDETPNPDYHLQFPFIRMLAGPLDYTPGSMRNVHQAQFEPIPIGIPMTMGTRTHEMAMYVLFDQPLGYLCDSPTEYRKNRVVMDFLSKVPTVWDETIPLSAKVGEYATIAKRSGEEWYLAAMTNHEERTIAIDFSFLPDDREYLAQIYSDNEQTVTNAEAYSYETIVVNNQTKLNYQLAAGGGLAMRLHGMVTGINDSGANDQCWIYQNEDHTQLNIKSNDIINAISIIDISGEVHYYQELVDHLRSARVNIDSLIDGLYIAKIETASAIYSLRFIK